jgi:16S rRNA (guanine527-N7)-methyltransferase
MTSREFATKLNRRLARADVGALPPEATERLAAYYQLLGRWNTRINLTSLALPNAPPATLDRLIVEPLAASRFVPEGVLRWADLGSGGGSPAVPLKIVRPAARLTMVEATTKKAAFLREVVRELGLTDTNVESIRIEQLAEVTPLGGVFDLATARALRITPQLLKAVARLLVRQGLLQLFAAGEPELSTIDEFTVGSIHKLVTGSGTRLVVLRPVGARVPRGTSISGPAPPPEESTRNRR